MGEIESVKWIADISVSLAFAAIVIYVLVRFIKSILKEHRDEIAKKDKDHEASILKLNENHRSEREALMTRLNDMDVYQRALTKDTYALISGFKEQLAQIQALREAEKIQWGELVNEKRNLYVLMQDMSNKLDSLIKSNG